MRLLLAQPDYRRHAEAGTDPAARVLPSRSLLELAALLERRGHQVRVLDPFTALGDNGDLDLAAALERTLEQEEFEAVGIAVYTPLRKEAHQLARIVKHQSRRIKVIVGGPHPGLLARSLLESWSEIDYVCLGAADESLPALIDSLDGKAGPAFRVQNIGLRTQAKTVRLTGKPSFHADPLGPPAVAYDKYFEQAARPTARRAYVITMRGCPHWCNFCSQLWKKVIPHDPVAAAAEIETLARGHGVKEVIIYDDCFGQNLEHARAMLAALIDRGVEVKLQAVTRFDAIHPDWLKLFVEAGGRDLLVGLETGSARLRKRMNKHVAPSSLCRGAELAREMGLNLGVFVMFGFPNETDADVEDTFRLLKKLDPAQVMSTVHEIKPGDLLFQFALTGEFLTPESWLDEDRRAITYLRDRELLRAAARAIAFDRKFTREVLLPEHDPADLTLGLDRAALQPMIEEEMKR